MKAIIIGAGRGRRLMPTTADTPKCFAPVQGRPILDWILEALAANGVTRIAFIGGYQIDKVRAAYPHFRFHHNADWENTNILASLMCAEAEMDEPFLSCYSDTLFTAAAVGRLLAAPADLSLLIDTAWLARYTHRTLHPPDDAEKVTARNGRITRVHRDIDPALAHGEFTGMARFTAAGAALLREHFHRSEAGRHPKAYLIHLFQEMIDQGVPFAHADTPGGYMEIDTQQDFELAQIHWP
jgi:choline kinase